LDELETEDTEDAVSCENSELEFCKLEINMLVFPFRFDRGAGLIFKRCNQRYTGRPEECMKSVHISL
jgi:hypothetical protein